MSAPALIILSGTFVGAELVAEFGRLPPSLLPNGGQPLYAAQCDMADALGARPILVLPEDYVIPQFDREWLADRGVAVVPVAADAALRDSLFAGLKVANGATGVYVLFGDTLVPQLRAWPQDCFVAGPTDHIAFWASYDDTPAGCVFREMRPDEVGTGAVVAGFFRFGETAALIRAAEGSDDLIGLLNAYGAVHPLSAVTDTDWFDFGHLFTYHQSRCRALLARSFNSVTSDGHSVVKSGTPARKIYAEAQWYKELPAQLRPYVPHFMGEGERGTVSYEVEYLYLPLMSELYCFTALPRSAWIAMLAGCRDLLETMQAIAPFAHCVPPEFPNLFFADMVAAKTRERLDCFAAMRGLSTDRAWHFNGRPLPSLDTVVDTLIAMVEPTRPEDVGVWHGDFHFGNIFYDFRSRKVRVVDPRGQLSNGTLTMYGDTRYDLAKLGHSILGRYDLLIADRYHLNYDGGYNVALDFGTDGAGPPEIETLYAEMTIGRYPTADRKAVALIALLFLSMLPLHASNPKRQIALLANGLRLSEQAAAL